jgi:hypothetical protein
MLQIKHFILLLVLLFGNAVMLHAQRKKTVEKLKEIKPTVYKKPIARKMASPNDKLQEASFGINFETNGWGLQIQRLRKKEETEVNEYRGFYIHFQSRRDPKEIKINSKLPSPSSDKGPRNLKYVYGKINSFYPLQIGYLVKKRITGKLEKNHIQLHGTGGAGFSLGLVKPYYLQIARNINGTFAAIDESYSELNADLFLNPRYVYGYSGFATGWSDLQIYPGVNVNGAIIFEYSPNNYSPLFVEIGGQLDTYFQKIPILVGEKSKAIFPFGYIALRKGMRW